MAGHALSSSFPLCVSLTYTLPHGLTRRSAFVRPPFTPEARALCLAQEPTGHTRASHITRARQTFRGRARVDGTRSSTPDSASLTYITWRASYVLSICR